MQNHVRKNKKHIGEGYPDIEVNVGKHIGESMLGILTPMQIKSTTGKRTLVHDVSTSGNSFPDVGVP